MTVQDVAVLLECSLTTARRELAALAAAGHVQRAHGGVTSVATESAATDPLAQVKLQIAAAAAALVSEGDTVGLTGGSTMLALATQLRGKRIGVVTNALEIALELVSDPNCRMMLLGGMVSPISLEVVGPETEAMVRGMSIDTLFMSVDGISAEAGVTTIGTLEALTVRAMAAQARRVIVAADHRKIGRSAMSRIMRLADVSTLITNRHPASDLDAMRAAGVLIIET